MYTVRRAADRDLAGALERIAATGYVGVELIGLHGMAPAKFVSHVERLDLEVIGTLLPCPDEPGIAAGLEEAKEIGAKVVITLLDEKYFVTPDGVRHAAELCNELCARLPVDMKLLYHNHWWEFTPRPDGTVPLFEFVGQLIPEVSLVADVYWIATSGADVAGALTELGPRVARLHLKDGPLNTEDPQVAVGDGNVDIAAAIRAAPQADWHVTELDEYDGDPFDALKLSYRYLTNSGLSRGRSGGRGT